MHKGAEFRIPHLLEGEESLCETGHWCMRVMKMHKGVEYSTLLCLRRVCNSALFGG